MPNIIIPKYRMLYHFTAAHSLKGIEAQGLWKGVMPWHRDANGDCCCIRHKNETRMTKAQLDRLNEIERKHEKKGRLYWRPGYQWLTTNPDFFQPWALLGNLPFPKNAYRLKILIPEIGTHRLYRWSELCRRAQPESAEEMNTKAVDWENWFVFYGPIPWNWICETPLRNMGQQITAEIDGAGGAG